MASVLISNTTLDSVNGAEEEILKRVSLYVRLVMALVTVLGWLGNYLCFKTAEQSNGTVLMKYLAVWGSLYLFWQANSIVTTQYLHINVSLKFTIVIEPENLQKFSLGNFFQSILEFGLVRKIDHTS